MRISTWSGASCRMPSPVRRFAAGNLRLFQLGVWLYLCGCNVHDVSSSRETSKRLQAGERGSGLATANVFVAGNQASAHLSLNPNQVLDAPPFYSGLPSNICSDQQYRNHAGKIVYGTKDCGTSDHLAPCNVDGQVDCLTDSRYPAMDASQLVEEQMLFSMVAGGIAGKLKPCRNAGEIGCFAAPEFSPCTRDGQENCILTTALQMVPKAQACHPICRIDGEQGCVVQNPFKAMSPSGITAWDLRSGHTLGGLAGVLKTNCRNGVNSSIFNHDGDLASVANAVTTSGIKNDPWDTVDGAPPRATGKVDGWSDATFCDGAVFVDVTTNSGGISLSTCGSGGVCIYQDQISNMQVTGILAGDAKSTSTTNPATFSWSDAIKACNASTYGGYPAGTWRLPTEKELMDLYVHGIGYLASEQFISSSNMQNKIWSATTTSHFSSDNAAHTIKWASGHGWHWQEAKSQRFPIVCVAEKHQKVAMSSAPSDCPEGSQTFSYTGANQTFTVPAACHYNLTFKVWAAGGGGGHSFPGGGGGFASGKYYVASKKSFTIVVGGGGGGTSGGTGSSGGFAGGGAGGDGAFAGRGSGGGGGGYSGVFLDEMGLIIAGGGGGGSGGGAGGAGGGNAGLPGSSAEGCWTSSQGGDQRAGGVSGTVVTGSTMTRGEGGSFLMGGKGGTTSSPSQWGGGGGGSGYHGGAGGGGDNGGDSCNVGPSVTAGTGGGGGAGYGIGSPEVWDFGILAGSGATAAQNTDSDYAESVGMGGDPQNRGGHGLVVVHYARTTEMEHQQEIEAFGVLCGSIGNSCYPTNPDGSTSAPGVAAVARGVAVTPSGKRLVAISGANNFSIWKDASSNKILKATGYDEWQTLLIPDGRGYSTNFADSTLIAAQIAGRRCPTNVYIDDSNKLSLASCLYFSNAYPTQRLDAPQNNGWRDQTTWGSLRLGRQTTGKWYEGNIQTCANYGMRLPTVYETTLPNFVGGMPTEVTATFSSEKGIPSAVGVVTWTATAHTGDNNRFWTWNGTSSGNENQDGNFAIRCVIP